MKSIAIKFEDIDDAFDFVSFGPMYEHEAFLNKETGKIYCHSAFGDNEEELPDDLGDEKYIEIPHKNELELGKALVFRFVYEHLSNESGKIEAIFRKRGAYARFKGLLENKGMLDKWYEYESSAQEKALRAWCEENEIEILG